MRRSYKVIEKALEEAGISYDENLVIDGDYTYDSGIEAFEKLWSLDEKPTAIFVSSDEMALGVIHAKTRHWIKCTN